MFECFILVLRAMYNQKIIFLLLIETDLIVCPNMVTLPYMERQHRKKCNIMIMIMAACPARPYQKAPPLPGLAVTRTLEERAAG